MSKKSTFAGLGLFRFLMPLLLWGAMACDPCRDLAEKMCACKESEAEKIKCKNDLNLAKSHKFFETTNEPGVCEEALKTCSCEDLMRGQDSKCGIYRRAQKSN